MKQAKLDDFWPMKKTANSKRKIAKGAAKAKPKRSRAPKKKLPKN